jgi:hypothetical protein
MTNPRPANADSAFIGHCLRIDEALKRITEARQSHFGVDPEQPRKWDEVGGAEYVANALERLAAWIEGAAQ